MKKKCEVHRSLRPSSCDDLLYMYFSILPFQYDSCIHNFVIFIRSGYTVEPLGTDTSLIRTPLYYEQFPMYRQNSHTFSLKNPSVIRTFSNTDNGHKISALGSKFIQT